MRLTDEEKLELLKQHRGSIHGPHIETVSIPVANFLAYTSAIEEKYQAQIAMLLHKLARFAAAYAYAVHDKNVILDLSELNEILANPQQTSDAFIAEVKAGAREEDAKRIERAGQHISWHHSAKDWPTDARTAIEIFSTNMAAELRNQAEGKE